MARSFNGSSDLINIGTVNNSSTNYTFSIWGKSPLVNTFNTLIDLGADILKIYVRSNGGTAAYTTVTQIWDNGGGPTPITADTWFNFVVTVATGGNVAAYVNGASDSTGTNSGVTSFNANCKYGLDDVSHFWGGSQADGALWSVILTAGEISALSKGARPNTIRPTSLLFWNPLDGIASPEPDLSGNKYNGTLTGTALASGPPIMMSTPRWPQNITAGGGGGGATTNFRRTLSQLGTRAGSRQRQAA